ncbi:unnamed protein product [Symbiodinium sp. CCMP2456]|nr:unnamed protein product [Symbiodinium sp. CCMP2456]
MLLPNHLRNRIRELPTYFATTSYLPQLVGRQLKHGWGGLQVRWATSTWQVSSHGRVKSTTGLISFGNWLDNGYYRVKVTGELYYVHRLVARAFLGPPDPCRWQVNHVDGNAGNNALSNLQYVSHSENQRHSFHTNPSRKLGAAKLGKGVWWRRLGDESWAFCPSLSEAARLLGVARRAVGRCYKGHPSTSSADGICYEFIADERHFSPHPGEIWKDAQYPGMTNAIANLTVSSHGRIWSKTTWRQNTSATKGTRMRNGYYSVGKGGRFLLVHRLVAATFLGQPPAADLLVNHVDGDRGNNHVDNLEYATPSQNQRHAISAADVGKRRGQNGKAVQARLISSNDPWMQFESLKDAAAHACTTPNRVSCICHGLARRHDRWEFRFMPQEEHPHEEWRPVVLEGARVDRA